MKVNLLDSSTSIEEIIKELRRLDHPITHAVWTHIAKRRNMSPSELFALVHDSKAPTLDHSFTPNTTYGPLTFEQKEEIYAHHSNIKTAELAALYHTNPQNISRAKRGEHRKQTVIERKPPTPLTPNTHYGPLTLEQKKEIYHHHQGLTATWLATLYNTNAQNVRIAQRTPPEQHYPSATDTLAKVRRVVADNPTIAHYFEGIL